MRCLLVIFLLLLIMVGVIMFVPDSREVFYDGLSALQQGVETLGDWGDRLTGAVDTGKGAVQQAGEAVDKAKAAVERISD